MFTGVYGIYVEFQQGSQLLLEGEREREVVRCYKNTASVNTTFTRGISSCRYDCMKNSAQKQFERVTYNGV